MSHASLEPYRDAVLDLKGLVAACSELLKGHVPTDARVAPRPDARTIRYYQTLGILDRPTYEGRRALYSYRHLVQALATKLLQGRGYSLAQVQTALSGRTTSQIAAAASQALGPSTPVPTPAKPTPHRPLVAVELAPGITVTVDPACVADVDALLRRFAAAIAPGATS